jgi:outer membrane protein assembly factor BamB
MPWAWNPIPYSKAKRMKRLLVVVGGIGLLVGSFGVPGNVSRAESEKDAEFSENIRLSPNRKARKSMEAAEDFIKEGSWGEAAHVLQGLLDGKEDAFVKVQRPGPDGIELVHWSSVRAEANRLLGTLPKQGLEVYEVHYGGKARALLDEAKKKSDAQLLAEVAQRYLHTKAGAAATELLGTYHLDRGRSVMAVLCFERLLNNKHLADGLKPTTLLKAAIAYQRGGDHGRANEIWQRLAKSHPGRLSLGGQEVALDRLRHELDRLPAEAVAVGPTPGEAGAPFLDEDLHKWHQATVRQAEARRWLDEAIAYQETRQQTAALPAFRPVAAQGRLIFRTHYGVVALDLKTGKPAWEYGSDWSLDRMAADSGKTLALSQWVPLYLQGGTANILFENSVLGSLCADNQLVYVIEDLAIPPHPQYLQQNAWGGRARTFLGPFEEVVNHNTLKALDLQTGKLKWQVGGKDEWSDSFFLGPPLPLAGKLYALVEKNSEIRLYCLDAATGTVAWKQTLASVRDKLPQDVARRIHAAHLAYGDGILVCPTNAGAILGVDLLTRGLVWAKPYREVSRSQEPRFRSRRLRYYQFGHNLKPDWQDAAPVIQDGKVIFTAPDGAAVECLNLRDGNTVWKAERKDDLYLAGVYRGKALLVGKRGVRALALADGKQVWESTTGVPSGRGAAGAKVYYLPLKAAADGKEPEVCALDIDTGKVVAHAKSRKKEVPGNLLFAEGRVVSQTIFQVAGYPQLEAKRAEVNALLAKDPKDPLGLGQRAELRLSANDVAGAVADLRTALAGKLDARVRAKARGKLFAALTELLESDFAKAEQYLDDYRDLCRVKVADGATPEERRQAEQEQQQRQARYLALLARGRERQGRLADALQAYREFGALARDGQLLPLPGEKGVKARPDVWAQGCIAALLDRATPSERKSLEETIRREWRTAQGKDVEKLRRFVTVFGPRFREGQEARLRLAQVLGDEHAPQTFTEAELLLLEVLQQDDAASAPRATEALVRLTAEKGLPADSAYWSRRLARDGKKIAAAGHEESGGQDPAELDPRQAWQGVLKVNESFGSYYHAAQPLVSLEPQGDIPPYFRRHRLAVNVPANELRLIDAYRNTTIATQGLTRSHVHLGYYNGAQGRCTCHLAGHVVVFQFGHVVYGYDPLGRKLLWEKNLLNTRLPSAYQVLPDGGGGYQAFYPDGRVQHVGRVAVVTASYVCVLTPDGLQALDPLKGTVLWARPGVPTQAQVFGDAQHVYVVAPQAQGQRLLGLAVRSCDGVSVPVPDFSEAFGHKIRTCGRCLLVSETGQPRGNLVLRLYDVQTGKDCWRQEFSPQALLAHNDDPNLLGVVEPDRQGKVTLIDLRTRRTLLSAAADPKDLAGVNEVHLLQDQGQFYLALNATSNPQARGPRPVAGALNNLIGLRSVPVNGWLYAFDRATGQLQWKNAVEQQMLVLEHFAELPFVLCTARHLQNGDFRQRQVSTTRCFDKRTGKRVYDKTVPGGTQFYALSLDFPRRKVELVGYNHKVEFALDGGAAR